jgi:hypothetical protein
LLMLKKRTGRTPEQFQLKVQPDTLFNWRSRKIGLDTCSVYLERPSLKLLNARGTGAIHSFSSYAAFSRSSWRELSVESFVSRGIRARPIDYPIRGSREGN